MCVTREPDGIFDYPYWKLLNSWKQMKYKLLAHDINVNGDTFLSRYWSNSVIAKKWVRVSIQNDSGIN